MSKIISFFLILAAVFGLGGSAYLTANKGAQSATFISSYSVEPEYYVNLNSIIQITCGSRTGTAVVIDRNVLLTVYHVTGEDSCTHDGKTFTTLYWNRGLDIAVLAGDTTNRPAIPLRCDGYSTDEEVFMIGYAGGKDFAVTRGIASRNYFNGYDVKTGQPFSRVRILNARSYRGMSGGPVLDKKGYVVGLINAVPTRNEPHKKFVYSREIKDIYACPAR